MSVNPLLDPVQFLEIRISDIVVRPLWDGVELETVREFHDLCSELVVCAVLLVAVIVTDNAAAFCLSSWERFELETL